MDSQFLLKALPEFRCINVIRDDAKRRWVKRLTWLTSIGRNAFVVLISASLAFYVSEDSKVSQLWTQPNLSKDKTFFSS